MNIYKPRECEHCVHEYAPTDCPCCKQCEVKKKNPKGFMDSNKKINEISDK